MTAPPEEYMELKVLLTGHNRRIAADISDHLKNERGCFAVSCSPTKSALFETVLSELPDVIIICLGDEKKETVKTFDVLSECTRLGAATLIVVANEPDRAAFINNTMLERVFFLARPVSLFALYDKLIFFRIVRAGLTITLSARYPCYILRWSCHWRKSLP